jgi:exodeoxyribonuclease VII small subunit
MTGGRGADVILDMVGGDYLPRNLSVLADDGRHVSIATQRGVTAEINILDVMRRRLTLTGSTLRPRSVAFKGLVAEELRREIWPFVESGQLRPVMDRTIPLGGSGGACADGGGRACRQDRAGDGSLEKAPYFTMLAGLAAQLVPAIVVLNSRSPWLQNFRHRGVALLILVLLPTTEEVFLNVMHIQFHLALGVALILCLKGGQGRLRAVFEPSILFLAPLCGPAAILLLPLFALRAVVDRDPSRWRQFAILASGAAIQLVLFYHPSGFRGVPFDPVTLAASLFIRLLVIPSAHAPCDRRLAGRQQLADLRADRRILRPPHPRGAGDRRRHGGDQADRPRSDPRGRADPRGDRAGQADPDYRLQMHKEPDPVTPHQGPALHAGQPSARTSPTASPGSSATIRKCHDGQIGKLIGTTRTTIAAIRDRSHWNIANIQPKDPVTLGLTSQRELDAAVAKAQKAAGIEHVDDTPLDTDRASLIEQLRAEREQHARDAEAAALARSATSMGWRRARSCPASATRSSTRPDARLAIPQARRSMDPWNRPRKLSFEAALARLEEIVRLLERGEAPLDQSIELYQEGDRLKRHCEARLKDAQARIEQIALGATASPPGVTRRSMPVETIDRGERPSTRGEPRRRRGRPLLRGCCWPSAATAATGLYQAMRHAGIGGGKRLRPLLTVAAARCSRSIEERALRVGARSRRSTSTA